MTAKQVDRFGHLAVPYLEQGEQVLDIAFVVPTRGAHGAGAGLARAVGEQVGQIGAVTGEKGSIADGFPHHLPQASTRLLCATDKRLLFLLADPARTKAQATWQVPRDWVRGVQRLPRLQLMARFRVHFTDGSSVSVLTTRRGTIDSLAGCLGRWQPSGSAS